MPSCRIVARISFTLTATHIDFEIACSPVRCIQIVVRLPPLVQGMLVRFISSKSKIVFMCHIRGASTVFCTYLTHWYLLHPPLDQELHLCENSTVFFLDRLSTLNCYCQRHRSDHSFHGRNAVPEVGSIPRLPRPTRWNAIFLHQRNRRSGLWSKLRQTSNRPPGLF